MEKNDKIYVAGYYGMVGSAIVRKLKTLGYQNVVGHSSKELDLQDQKAVEEFFKKEKPDYVFLAAAKVGGIYANSTYPADFIYNNLQIQNNIFYYSHVYHVKKLLFMASSCIYPRLCEQPMKESSLLTGALEPTNEFYAIAKIAGVKMVEAFNKQYHTNFISCMPTNLYGQNDRYDILTSHVLPALLRRIHEAKESGAKEVVIWGTGKALREFLHVADLADASIFLMNEYEGNETVNIGSGKEVSIRELVEIIKNVVGYEGGVVFDSSKPDGTPRKLLDSTKINILGWQSKINLAWGIRMTYKDFLKSNVRM